MSLRELSGKATTNRHTCDSIPLRVRLQTSGRADVDGQLQDTPTADAHVLAAPAGYSAALFLRSAQLGCHPLRLRGGPEHLVDVVQYL